MGLSAITRSLGYQQVNAAGTAAVFGLTIPVSYDQLKPSMVVIQAEAQPLRYRDDGVNPTTSVGMLIPANASIEYTGDLLRLRLVNGAAGAIMNASFYV